MFTADTYFLSSLFAGITDKPQVKANTWYHVVVVRNHEKRYLSLYLNGQGKGLSGLPAFTMPVKLPPSSILC